MNKEDKKQYIFDDRTNVKRFLYAFFGVCALSVIIDLFIHKHHAHFDVEKWPSFYAVYGFIAFVFIVVFAKHVVRPLIMRDEDYYDD